MPYIDKELRKSIDPVVEISFKELKNKPPGEWNYFISRLLWKLWKSNKTYVTACLIAGTLVLVLFEFVRRMLNPYEDKKIKQNGDLPEGE